MSYAETQREACLRRADRFWQEFLKTGCPGAWMVYRHAKTAAAYWQDQIGG